MRERQCVRCMQWLCCVLVVGKVWRIVPCVYKIYTLDRFQFHGLLRNIPTRFSGAPLSAAHFDALHDALHVCGCAGGGLFNRR